MPPSLSCESSLEARETMAGTATEASTWLCLEYRGAWGRKAFEESDLAEDVKAHLQSVLDAVPDSRLQLIRKPGRTTGRLAFLAAVVKDDAPTMARLEFDEYRQLLNMPLLDLLRSPSPDSSAAAPVVLVCGNGRRDACCARYGTAVYRRLAGAGLADVWLSNHQGGHRFAANVTVLPDGLQFGRMRPESAAHVLRQAFDGQLNLDHLRGRVSHPRVAQAAEHFLRAQVGMLQADALSLDAVEQLENGSWRVAFVTRATGHRSAVELATRPSDFEVFKTSGDPSPTKVKHFELVRITA